MDMRVLLSGNLTWTRTWSNYAGVVECNFTTSINYFFLSKTSCSNLINKNNFRAASSGTSKGTPTFSHSRRGSIEFLRARDHCRFGYIAVTEASCDVRLHAIVSTIEWSYKHTHISLPILYIYIYTWSKYVYRYTCHQVYIPKPIHKLSKLQ